MIFIAPVVARNTYNIMCLQFIHATLQLLRKGKFNIIQSM